MHFPREVCMRTPAECEWLKDTHLQGLHPPPFGSFVLYGSNEHPARIDLYESARFVYDATPILTYTRDDRDELVGPKSKVIRRTRK